MTQDEMLKWERRCHELPVSSRKGLRELLGTLTLNEENDQMIARICGVETSAIDPHEGPPPDKKT